MIETCRCCKKLPLMMLAGCGVCQVCDHTAAWPKVKRGEG